MEGTDLQGPDTEHGLSLFGTASALLKYPRLLVGAPVMGIVLGILAGLLQGSQFVATSTFFPESGPQRFPAGLAGVAAQFGLNLGGGAENRSVDFYAGLLKSDHVLSQVVQQPLAMTGPAGDTTVTLVDLYGAATAPDRKMRAAAGRLNGQVFVGTDVKAGIIRVRTVAESRELAERINRLLLQQVNTFNLERRQTVAGAERHFVEERLGEAQASLRQAEDELARFMEANRLYQQDARLSFQAARLQRTVDLRQQVVQALAQAFEQARIDEVRNTPVVTIVDPPEGTGRPSSRLTLFMLLGAFLGGAFGLGSAILFEFVRRTRTEDPEAFTEFDRLRRSFVRRVISVKATEVRQGTDGSRRTGAPV